MSKDIEKAIKGMENIKDYWSYRVDEVNAATLALEALNKQIPVKLDTGEYDEEGEFQYLLCPICKREVGYFEDECKEVMFIYCPDCGQKLEE